jgi:hypothetical protein
MLVDSNDANHLLHIPNAAEDVKIKIWGVWSG